jgi:hypothetical protein
MTEQITMQVEIDGALQEADVSFEYYGPTAVQIDEVFVGNRPIDDLTFNENRAITSKIVAHKLGHKGIAVKS